MLPRFSSPDRPGGKQADDRTKKRPAPLTGQAAVPLTINSHAGTDVLNLLRGDGLLDQLVHIQLGF